LSFDGFGDDTCDFAPGGQYLLTECHVPSEDGSALDVVLRLWDVRDHKKHHDISWAQPFAFSPTAPAAAMSREFRELLLIDFKDTTAPLLVAFKKKHDLLEAVCFSADGKTMVVGTYAGNVYVFDLQSGNRR
jgi:WD40 repeat protein